MNRPSKRQAAQGQQAGQPTQAAATDDPCPWIDPGPDGERLGLEDFLTFKLTRLASAGQRSVTATYLEKFNLGISEWQQLAALARYSPAPFGQLVSLSSLDKALVSRSIRSLVARGLATTSPDPEHGKRLVCSISAKGRALFRRILPQAQRRQAALLARLSTQERIVLHQALRKLEAALDRSADRSV